MRDHQQLIEDQTHQLDNDHSANPIFKSAHCYITFFELLLAEKLDLILKSKDGKVKFNQMILANILNKIGNQVGGQYDDL